jgi:hypothetical protein
MRTTVTLDPDTESLVRRLMTERGVSFKQALNDAIRAGADARPAQPFRTASKRMGRPAVSLDRALRIAGELEDDELTRRLHQGR